MIVPQAHRRQASNKQQAVAKCAMPMQPASKAHSCSKCRTWLGSWVYRQRVSREPSWLEVESIYLVNQIQVPRVNLFV